MNQCVLLDLGALVLASLSTDWASGAARVSAPTPPRPRAHAGLCAHELCPSSGPGVRTRLAVYLLGVAAPLSWGKNSVSFSPHLSTLLKFAVWLGSRLLGE